MFLLISSLFQRSEMVTGCHINKRNNAKNCPFESKMGVILLCTDEKMRTLLDGTTRTIILLYFFDCFSYIFEADLALKRHL